MNAVQPVPEVSEEVRSQAWENAFKALGQTQPEAVTKPANLQQEFSPVTNGEQQYSHMYPQQQQFYSQGYATMYPGYGANFPQYSGSPFNYFNQYSIFQPNQFGSSSMTPMSPIPSMPPPPPPPPACDGPPGPGRENSGSEGSRAGGGYAHSNQMVHNTSDNGSHNAVSSQPPNIACHQSQSYGYYKTYNCDNNPKPAKNKQAPGTGGIKFNLPKRQGITNNSFNNNFSRGKGRNKQFQQQNSIQKAQTGSTGGNEDKSRGSMSIDVKTMSNDCWPPSLQRYVSRAYSRCKTDTDKDMVEIILKGKLIRAHKDGSMETTDWDKEPLPSIHSDQANGVQSRLTSSTTKLPNTRSGNNSNWGSRNSSSKNRSKSRSRSRSRTPPSYRERETTKSKKRRNSSSSSDSSTSESSSSRKLSSSIVGPTRGRSQGNFNRGRVRNHNFPTGNKKSKKNRTKNLEMQFSVELDVETTERLQKRAARFQSGDGISNKKQKSLKQLTLTINNSGCIDDSPDIDWSNFTIVGTSSDLEKPYLRLTTAPDPATVRPVEVLKKSLVMVKEHWVQKQDYRYACDQLKSVRQDLTVQCVRDKFTVQVYETHARIALEKGDHEEFNQCQTQLRALYGDIGGCNQLEFVAYRILYFIFTQNTLDLTTILASLSTQEKQEETISHALNLRSAWALNNYHKFFRLYQVAPKMSGYLIDWFVERVRKSALKTMIKSYRPLLAVSYVESELAFTSTEECLKFLGQYGVILLDDFSKIDCKLSLGAVASF